MKGHTYAGEYRSAIARAKRLLLAAGLEWSVTTGRYSPYENEQKTSPGFRVVRVGVSETITLHVYGEYERGTRKEWTARAVAVLRAGGLPFDDRGWLACGRDAERAAS